MGLEGERQAGVRIYSHLFKYIYIYWTEMINGNEM